MAVNPRVVSTSARSGLAFGPFAYAVFGFLALCAFVTIVGSKDAADAAGALGVMAGAGLSGTLFLVRARALDGRERLGWSLVGIGLLIAALGVLVVGIVFFVRGDAPAFGWTDLFFLSTYVVIVAGFAALPQTQGTPLQRWRMVLDGLIGAVSVTALMWVFFLSDLLTDLADTSLTAKVIGGFYPFLDVVAITVAMSVLLRRSRHRFDIRLALFTVGIFFQVLGDLAFFVSGHAGSFDEAEPLYVINLIAVAFFFASASLIGLPATGREYADRNPPLWTQIAPYIPAVGMLLVFLGRAFVGDDPQIDPILLASTILVGLLVIARQGVAIVENRAYIEQQRNALVSTISHELRTPLTAIVGFVELLQEDDAAMHDDERQGMLTIVHQQADYMSRIVSDLIMLARDSGGEMRLDVQPVRIADLATASVHAAGVQPSTIEIQCPSDLVAFVDPGRMQQVLVNLITNASRYGGQHRLLRATVDGSDLIFSVHDDGAGIPRRYEVRVWDRFERGPNRLNASVPGSGIGLAIVRAIADAHGGTATYMTSDVLGGACFVVRLPGRVTSAAHSGMAAGVDTALRSTT